MNEDRRGCCAGEPICAYHQGWRDAVESMDGPKPPRCPDRPQCEAITAKGHRCVQAAAWPREGRMVCGLHQFTASRYVDPSP